MMTLTKTEEDQLAEFLITDIGEVLLKYLSQLQNDQREKVFNQLGSDINKARDEYLKCEGLSEAIKLLTYKRNGRQTKYKKKKTTNEH